MYTTAVPPFNGYQSILELCIQLFYFYFYFFQAYLAYTPLCTDWFALSSCQKLATRRAESGLAGGISTAILR